MGIGMESPEASGGHLHPTAAERIGKKRTRGVTGSNRLLEASKARERAGGR